MVWWLLSGVWAADPDAAALYAAALACERAADPACVIDACEALLQGAPEDERAPRCERRLTWYRSLRDDDGGWAGWVSLEVARRLATDQPEAAAAIAQEVAARPGLGRGAAAEVAAWRANDALDRLGDPARAVTLTDVPWAGRDGLAEDTRRVLGVARTRALLQAGREEEAAEVRAQLASASVPPTWRRLLRPFAGASVAMAVAMLWGSVRGRPVDRSAAGGRPLVIMGFGVAAALVWWWSVEG